MAGVDLHALQNLRKKGGPKADALGLHRRSAKAQAPAQVNRDCGEGQERQPARPAERGEGAEEHLVRVLREDVAEAQRAEAEWAHQQHRDRAHLIAKTPLRARIVVLRQRRALQRELANHGNRKHYGDDDGDEHAHKRGHHHRAGAQPRRLRGEEGDAEQQRYRKHAIDDGAA